MKNNRLKILRETLSVLIFILLAKVGLHYYEIELLSTTPLHTGLLAGSIFVIGFILSGAHSDYKESEKMPVDLTTSLESIYQDGLNCKQEHSDFDLSGLKSCIIEILDNLNKDIHKHTDTTFTKAKELGTYISQMEKLGLPANYIVKLKTEQNTILRIIQRSRYLQRIQPLPSAFILVQSIVGLIITMLLFTKIGSLTDEIVVTGFLSFTYIYLYKLVEVIDTPFHPEGETQDDISLFLLEEQQDRINS